MGHEPDCTVTNTSYRCAGAIRISSPTVGDVLPVGTDNGQLVPGYGESVRSLGPGIDHPQAESRPGRRTDDERIFCRSSVDQVQWIGDVRCHAAERCRTPVAVLEKLCSRIDLCFVDFRRRPSVSVVSSRNFRRQCT